MATKYPKSGPNLNYKPRGNPNIKNYSPFKKGVSFNPGGRPKGIPCKDTFKALLEKIGQEDLLSSDFIPLRIKRQFNKSANNPSLSLKEAAMRVAYIAALDGRDWALRFVIDYTEGKPKEFLQISQKRETIDIEGEKTADTALPLGEKVGDDESSNSDTAISGV